MEGGGGGGRGSLHMRTCREFSKELLGCTNILFYQHCLKCFSLLTGTDSKVTHSLLTVILIFLLITLKGNAKPRGRVTPYSGLYGKALRKRGTFNRLEVY